MPTFYAAFLASPSAPQRSEVKIARCISAGEALPEEISRKWKARYGVDILDGLGSTEMLHIYLQQRARVRPNTAPAASRCPATTSSCSATTARRLRRGELGELYVRGPTSAIMYWNNRERSRSTFQGEWTRSGDKYYLDEDGYYVCAGRQDDMLKVSGMYVSPFEVEAALASHPEVLEAAVVGWFDDEKLVKPKAFVVLKLPDKASEALAAGAARPRQAGAGAVQIPALDRVPHRIAEDRDRQDPALQAAGGRAVVIAARPVSASS